MDNVRAVQHSAMDWRDLALWALVAAFVVPVCWAGKIWVDSFETVFFARQHLLLASSLAAGSILGTPLLAGLVAGRSIGWAFARGVALSVVALTLLSWLLMMTSTLLWESWSSSIVGSLYGFALGLSWAMAIRMRRLAWVIGSAAGGVVASLIGWSDSGFDGWGFGMMWALLGLPLAWLLRASHPSTQSVRPQPWRLLLPSATALASVALVVIVAEGMRPCGFLTKSFSPALCLHEVAIGDLGNVYSLAFAADGASIFLGGDRLNEWGAVEHRRLSDGQLLGRFTTAKGVIELGMSPDGRRLVGFDWSKTIYVWDVHNGRELHRFRSDELFSPTQAVFSADGRYVAMAYHIYDLEAGIQVDLAAADALAKHGISQPSRGYDNVWSPDGSLQTILIAWSDERLEASG